MRNIKLKYSFPQLTSEMLDKVQDVLTQRFGYGKIPEDYRSFLLKNNGGFVSPGFIDDTKERDHQHEVVFDTPLKWVRDHDRPVTPSLIAFFGIWLEEDMDEKDVENWDLYSLILSNAHSREDFDVLPDNMMSIAKCQHPEAADILCISLEEEDYGAIYYNYGMCDHPSNFHGDYYEKIAMRVLTNHNIESADELDEEIPEERKIINELKRVTFVKVADSFTAFLAHCREKVL